MKGCVLHAINTLLPSLTSSTDQFPAFIVAAMYAEAGGPGMQNHVKYIMTIERDVHEKVGRSRSTKRGCFFFFFFFFGVTCRSFLQTRIEIFVASKD